MSPEGQAKIKILLIDDDPLVLKSIQALLEKEGYACYASPNARQGLEECRANHFDLIISDIRMPGKNGVEAAQEISRVFKEKAKKEIPLLFITGYAELADTLKAEKLGEVILKPFDNNRFLMTIREYL